MQQELQLARSLRIVRIDRGDAERRTDQLADLKTLVLENESVYPQIGSWWSRKVLSGIANGERTAFVGYDGAKPVVSAIVKRGAAAKFCHLKLGEDVRDRNLGEIFFSLMALEVRSTASSIHFTLPEGLWSERAGFFRSFGFSEFSRSPVQYRSGEDELRCEATFSSVWSGVLHKLPKLGSIFRIDDSRLDNQLLLSIQPRWAEAVLSGRKKVEIRRRFSSRWVGRRMSLYASRPLACLVGEATITQVIADTPLAIWQRFGPDLGVTREEFDSYVRDSSRVYAIVLADVSRYRSSVPLRRMQELVSSTIRPPQSHLAIQPQSPWGQAVSIASLLGSRLPPAPIL